MEIEKILLKKNLPHVVTALGNGQFEDLYEHGPIHPRHVILGMAELNRNGISLLNISVGNSKEGITKIDKSVIENGSIYDTKNEQWIGSLLPNIIIDIPEGEDGIVPFKSDTWVLGEFLIRNVYHPEGKSIPKKFMKSQTLLNTFIDSLGPEAEFLKRVLVLDPYTREYTWNILKNDYETVTVCNVQ